MPTSSPAEPNALPGPRAPAPFVSVVIPTYNRAGMLCDCIDSVLASTFHDCTASVMDGALPDGVPTDIRGGLPSLHSCLSGVRHP